MAVALEQPDAPHLHTDTDKAMPYEPYQSPFMSNRVQRQFGDAFQPDDSLSSWQPQDYQPQQMDSSQNYYNDVRQAYGSTPALDAYRQHLKQAPDVANYQPTKWDRLAAGLSGASAGFKDAGEGIKVAMGLNRSRYNTALSDYYNQAAPLKEAAGLERQGIDDMVGHIMKANELGIKYDDYRRQLEKDRGDLAVRNREAATGEGRLGWDQEYGRKRLTQFDKDINSLASFRNVTGAAQTKNANTGAFAAQTGRINANTGQYNAQTQRTGVENQGRNIDSMITNRNEGTLQGWAHVGNESDRVKKMGQAGGTDMEKFQQSELQNLRAKYPDFVTMDDAGDYVIDHNNVPSVNSPEYQDFLKFQRELESNVNHRATLGQMQIGGDSSNAPNSADNPWELLGPGQ